MVARRLPGYRRILIAGAAFLLSSCIHAQTVTPRVTIIPTQDGSFSGVNIPTNPTSYTYGLRIHGSQARELFTADTYGTSTYPGFYATSSRGTEAAQSAVLNGNHLAIFAGGGYDGANLQRAQGWVTVEAADDWTPTSRATEVRVYTTPSGGTTPIQRLSVGQSGVTTFNYDVNLSSGKNIIPVVSTLSNVGSTARHFGSGWIDDMVMVTASLTGTFTSGNIYPGISATYSLGNASAYYASTYTKIVTFPDGGGNIAVTNNTGTELVIGGGLSPSVSATYDMGSVAAKWNNGYFRFVNVYNALFMTSGTTANIQSGATLALASGSTLTSNGNSTVTGSATVRNSAGTGTCVLAFDKGILTGSTC